MVRKPGKDRIRKDITLLLCRMAVVEGKRPLLIIIVVCFLLAVLAVDLAQNLIKHKDGYVYSYN